MIARLAALMLAAVWAGAASAESLVSTLSDAAVEITSNFTGEQIVVFGAIRGAPENPDPPYAVAVVVQGPSQDLVVRRKGRVLGIWANRATREFESVPSYYVMHLSEGFGAAVDASQLRQYRLGIASLPFVASAAAEPTGKSFADAVIVLKGVHGLYVQREGAVRFLAPDVFRSTFFLPSDVPTGEYRVSVYLFRGATFLAGDAQTLLIEKGGFSEQIARAADGQPFFYGLAAVALAVFTGWFAGVIFRRP